MLGDSVAESLHLQVTSLSFCIILLTVYVDENNFHATWSRDLDLVFNVQLDFDYEESVSTWGESRLTATHHRNDFLSLED